MFTLRPILDCDIAYCRMTRSSTAAVYGFPLDEENGFPVCLILFSPHFLIEIFDDLIAVINELDLTYELQLFPCRTELHIADMGVTRKFCRGGLPFPGGGQTLARTSFIRLKPIHIKESSDSRGGPEHPPAPPP